MPIHHLKNPTAKIYSSETFHWQQKQKRTFFMPSTIAYRWFQTKKKRLFKMFFNCSQLSKKLNGCTWTWETIQLYTYTQIKVKQQCFNCFLHFTVTVRSSIMSMSHTLKWVGKWLLIWNWVVFFTSANKCKIWTSFLCLT